MFLPSTINEMKQLGWNQLDVILITGDAYIDSPFIGVAVIGKLLSQKGYRVGIIAQPDSNSSKDISRLGEPKLFWGVTGGCIDSMVANRTASGKKRNRDDYTPGGKNNRRPDRAVIVYSNLIRSHFKQTVPVVLGGIEASLRRITHYDFWTNKIRRSVLFDSRADFLIYGMAEKTTIEFANCLKNNNSPYNLKGLCYISKNNPEGYMVLPSYQEVVNNKKSFTNMFKIFYQNNDPITATGLIQQQDTRYLVQNPPANNLTSPELDAIHDLNFERELHPYYARLGPVKALETIRFSITTHRGCYGECNFCAIALHQGRTVQSRSKKSIVNEAREITKHPLFKGTIHDVGGPTANMYGFECQIKLKKGACKNKRCLQPEVCSNLKIQHNTQISLLQELRRLKNIKHIFIASGIRYDMIINDKKAGTTYLRELIRHHISGQMKIAPEHSENHVLQKMGKPQAEVLLHFRDLFNQITKRERKKLFLTYYMIAAHPGCTMKDMIELKMFCQKNLNILPRQIQIFTPTPSTYSTLMFYTQSEPFSGEKCFIEKSFKGREMQKNVLVQQSMNKGEKYFAKGKKSKKNPPRRG